MKSTKEYNTEYWHKNKDKIKARRAAHTSTNFVRVIGRRNEWKYGITLAVQASLVNRYNGACWICRTTMDVVNYDHDHSCCPGLRSCGKCIRGVLCRRCNLGIGYFLDDSTRLAAAIEYINSRRPLETTNDND